MNDEGISTQKLFDSMMEESDRLLDKINAAIQQHASTMPAAAFVIHPKWANAAWSATTYQFHPTSEAPPILGFVFDNAEAGLDIFRSAEKTLNHTDRFEEIRVVIIEGGVGGQEQRPGYTVRLGVDPDSLAAHATMQDLVVDPKIVPLLGQWNRHYPIPGQPNMLAQFKAELEKHKEFLLAPVTRRADGQLWATPELGIIKNLIEFRDLSEISEDDPDAAALLMPQLVVPPANA